MNYIFSDITACCPAKILLTACLVPVSSFIDPEDGGDMFVCNIGWLSPGNTALYTRNLRSHHCESLKSKKLGNVHMLQLWRVRFLLLNRVESRQDLRKKCIEH
jgi:hypothetical protein